MDEKRLEENKHLRKKLDQLLNEARRNEKTQASYDNFSLSVMAAQGPKELFTLLLNEQKNFRIDEIRLCLIDRFHEVERLLTDSYQHSFDGLSFIDADTNKLQIANIPNLPVLGTRILTKYNWLLNFNDCEHYQSAALLPLKSGGEIIGVQLLLSKDIDRYSKDDGTTFLHKLAAMTAISIENCINRQRILKLGYQDGLTDAYNRRYFDERLKREIDRSQRNKTDLVCLFIDIDFFKKINDNYGHQVGDIVLVKLVELMRDQVRSSDIVARYGGEEFAIILPETGIQVAHEVAERIRREAENQKLTVDDKTVSITVSIGLASLSQILHQPDLAHKKSTQNSSENLDKALLGKADEALYQAKQTGRNQVVIKRMTK
jgi:diguanylate cyclase (GGDEF)-like protein